MIFITVIYSLTLFIELLYLYFCAKKWSEINRNCESGLVFCKVVDHPGIFAQTRWFEIPPMFHRLECFSLNI